MVQQSLFSLMPAVTLDGQIRSLQESEDLPVIAIATFQDHQ